MYSGYAPSPDSDDSAEVAPGADLAQAEEALRRILSGDVAGGVADYTRISSGAAAFRLPIGLHLRLLRQAGHTGAAATLERVGLENGCDLLAMPIFGQMAPERRVAAYRELFSRGLVNAAMLARYADALSETGDGDALADLMNPDRLLRVTQPGWTAPDGSGRPLHAALDDALARLKVNATWDEQAQSVRNMFILNKVLESDDPCIRHLVALLRVEVDRALAGLNGYDPRHRLPPPPERFQTVRQLGNVFGRSRLQHAPHPPQRDLFRRLLRGGGLWGCA